MYIPANPTFLYLKVGFKGVGVVFTAWTFNDCCYKLNNSLKELINRQTLLLLVMIQNSCHTAISRVLWKSTSKQMSFQQRNSSGSRSDSLLLTWKFWVCLNASKGSNACLLSCFGLWIHNVSECPVKNFLIRHLVLFFLWILFKGKQLFQKYIFLPCL